VKVLVLHSAPRAGGRSSVVRKTVNAEWVRIGRNASCEIHLADPRIALEQGMIVNRDGLVYLEGEAGSQDISRKAVRAVRMKPGEPIDIGPYRMELIATPQGYDAAVSVSLLRPRETVADLGSRSARQTLASLGFSKRGAAWIGLLVVLAAFLFFPAGRVLHLPWSGGGSDRMWNPGPVMLAHQPIADRCEACHETAFEHVTDRACLACHATVGHHVSVAMRAGMLFDGVRCASCHREHKGVKPVQRDDDRFCIDCHRAIHAQAPDAHVKDTSDFARSHPAFVLSVRDPHLAFPHDKHLDPHGVRSPKRGRPRLDCADCHVPDASKRMFEPISMARACQECHRLDIEPAVTTREVPHGDPRAAVAMIEEFYAALALNGVADSFTRAFGVPGEGLLRRVGTPSTGERQDALRLATRKAAAVASDLFEVRVCKTCHEVKRQSAPGAKTPEWSVAPVSTTNRWMPRARFDHHAHERTPCKECHDVARSKSSRDVSMPGIDACRRCHAGSSPQEGKVTSSCLLCHGFHDARFAWDPRLAKAIAK
jgi:predicted CXXCH cytochrome family protein